MSPWLVCSTARRAGEVDSVTPPLCHDRRARSDPPWRAPAQDAGAYSSRFGDRLPASFTTPVVALPTRFDATADGDSGEPGLRDRSTAAAPVTCGVAIEVPEIVLVPVSQSEVMPTPGANRSRHEP